MPEHCGINNKKTLPELSQNVKIPHPDLARMHAHTHPTQKLNQS